MSTTGGALDGFVSTAIPDDAWRGMHVLLRAAAFRLQPPLVREHALGHDVLVSAWWREQVWSSRGSNGPAYTRLLLHFHRPGMELPEFEIVPRDGAGNRALGFVADLAGLPTLSMPGQPEFNGRYRILTSNLASTRSVLEHADLAALARAGDLRIRANDRGLLVMRAAKATPEELERLVLDASLALIGVTDDPQVGARALEAAGGDYGDEQMRTLLASGSFASQAKRLVVPPEAAAELREQAPPRQRIDRSIGRRAWRGTAEGIVIASIFAVGFLGSALLVAFATPPGSPRELLVVLFTLLGVGASIALALVIRRRRTRRRIVREGRVVPARVVSVERTRVVVNGDPVHRVTLRLDESAPASVAGGGVTDRHDDDAPTLSVRVSTFEMMRARRMMRAEEPTWVLVDPRNPKRALWPDGWVVNVTRPK